MHRKRWKAAVCAVIQQAAVCTCDASLQCAAKVVDSCVARHMLYEGQSLAKSLGHCLYDNCKLLRRQLSCTCQSVVCCSTTYSVFFSCQEYFSKHVGLLSGACLVLLPEKRQLLLLSFSLMHFSRCMLSCQQRQHRSSCSKLKFIIVVNINRCHRALDQCKYCSPKVSLADI